MFQIVDVNHLQVNQKYKIESEYDFKGNFKKSHLFLNGRMYAEFVQVYNVTTKENCFGKSFFCHTSKYYEFVSKKPQWKMERRSVNMILRRLLGDEHFEW